MTSPDILDLDFDAYLDRIRRLTDEELIPGEAAMVELGEVPPPLVDRLAECGLFGITLPRHWGGLGWSMEQQVRLTFEFTRASPVYRSRFSTTIGLCSQILHDHGTDEQKERYLRDMAIGRCVASFALTETGAGSDATAVTTTAVRDGDQYVINGHKRFITNGAWADLLVVFVRTGDAGFSAILVPADTPGVTATLPSRMNGHEAGPVAELSFTDVHVPTTNLVGDEGAGLKLALRGINHARTHVAATAVGCATRLLTEATAHALTRHQFGQPIAQFGVIEAMLGRSRAELEAARALAVIGPMPGMVSRRRLTSFERCQAWMRFSAVLISSWRDRNCLARLSRHVRAKDGNRASSVSAIMPSSFLTCGTPTGATMPNSAMWARIALITMVRWRTSNSRVR